MKYTIKLSLSVISMFMLAGLQAQNVAINSTGATANASAILDITSTSSGLLIPRMTSAQKSALSPLPAAAQGLIVYQTDGLQGFYYNTSTTTTPSWNYLTPGGWSLTGNSGTSAAGNFIGTTDAVDWVVRTNNTERLRILSGGNVGIGTTSPAQKLDVQGGNARINNTFLGDVGHGSGWGGFSHSSMNTTTGYGLLQSSDGNYTLINKENTGSGYIGFRIGNGDVAAIVNSGNFGIATTSPAYRFTIANGYTFGYGDGSSTYSSRTESRADAGLQGNSGAQSGFFQTSAPSPSTDWPTGTASTTGFDASGNATSWWHLLDVRHSNDANNYAMQFSGSFFDQRLFFRKTNGSATTAWSEVLTSSATIGQSSTSYYSTAAVTLAAGAGSFSYCTGFPVTVTIPANCTVLVTGDVGVATNSAGTAGYSVVDVALFVDGVIPTDGAYQRLCPSNNGGLVGQTAVSSISQSFSSLSAGNHTFGLAGINLSGGSSAVIGGNNASVLQAEMTITIIKK